MSAAGMKGSLCSIFRRCGVAFAICFGMAQFTHSANAQTVDYGALEQLFGEPVTTSATGQPQRATEVAANIEIITADEIRRSGAYDIPGVLRHVVGIDVQRWTNDAADVGIRGYVQPYAPGLLVLLDGRQVYGDHYGLTLWNAIPVELSAIRQIEVVKGPNSALYGFNAVYGVVNIVTYNPMQDDVDKASVRGGTQGFVSGSVVQSARLGDKAALRLSAGASRDDDFSTALPPPPAVPGFTTSTVRKDEHRFGLNALGVVSLGARTSLELEATHTKTALNGFIPVYVLSNENQTTTSVKLRLTADTNLGLVKGTVYTNWLHHVADIGGVSIPGFENRVTVAQFEDVFRIGADHTLRASVEYRHNQSPTIPIEGGLVSYDIYSAAGMWNWAITPQVALTNAVRLDEFRLGRKGLIPPFYPFVNSDWDRSISELSYNSAVVWKVDAQNTLRVLAARGVQLPSLSKFGAYLLVSPFFGNSGTPFVDPTVVTNYELAWDRELSAIDAAFRLAVFYTKSQKLVADTAGLVLEPGAAPLSTPANIGDSKAKGVELSLHGRFMEHWRWSASYRVQSIDDTFIPGAQNGAQFIDYEHLAPEHVIKANLGWSRDKWEVDGYAYYQSRASTLALGAGGLLGLRGVIQPLSDYVSVDGRIAYRVTEWASLAVSGQNLANSSQKQNSAPEVERRVFATLTVNY